MHQYKTVAQTLLILSIFNLVLAAPVVRETHDARDDVAGPVVVRNVATMSKERRQPMDAGPLPSPPPSPDMSTPSHPSPQYSNVEAPPHHPPPDGSTPSHSPAASLDGSIPSISSSQFPDGPYSPPPLSDGLTSLHSSPLLPGWLLHTPSASNEVESLPELPTSQGGPGEIVPATDQSVPVRPATGLPVPVRPAMGLPVPVRDALRVYMVTQTTQMRNTLDAQLAMPVQEAFNKFLKKLAAGVAIFGITGALVAYYRHRTHVHREIDPDCSMAKGSPHPCIDD